VYPYTAITVGHAQSNTANNNIATNTATAIRTNIAPTTLSDAAIICYSHFQLVLTGSYYPLLLPCLSKHKQELDSRLNKMNFA